MQNHRLQAHTAVLLANIIFGLGVPVTKLLLDQWVSPMAYMATRCLGAAAIFWLISLFLPREKVAPRDLTVIGYRGVANAHGMGTYFHHARLLFAHRYAYTRSYHALCSPLHRRKNIGTRHRRRCTWCGWSHAHGVYWVARRLG